MNWVSEKLLKECWSKSRGLDYLVILINLNFKHQNGLKREENGNKHMLFIQKETSDLFEKHFYFAILDIKKEKYHEA